MVQAVDRAAVDRRRGAFGGLVGLALLLAGCGSGGASTTGTGGAGGGACSIARPTPSTWRLHADGTLFRDALDRIVILRGVDAGGRSKFAPYVPFDYAGAAAYDAALAAYLDRAQSWGIDALRVPFTWAAVEPSQGTDDDAFLAQYDALLDAAWARGMYTIVDFHQDVYSEVYCGDGFPGWTVANPPAPAHDCPDWSGEYFSDSDVEAAFDAFWADGSTVQAAYGALWDRIATRYASRAGVIGFELFNEPGWGTADYGTFEATTLTTFFGTMGARVRQSAPDTLVFFDLPGPDAGTVTTMVGKPTGDGLVFAPHYYQLPTLTEGAGQADLVKLDLTRWSDQGKAWDVPTHLGEFGISNMSPGTEAYAAAHYDALDALGMSGTQWEYSVSVDAWNSEDLGLCLADGTETPQAAAIIRPFPRAVAGAAPSFSYDDATGAATLTYTAASGVTELSVPARAYPKGYDVTVTGGCYDTSTPGTLLVQAAAGAGQVEVQIAPK
jgi:endoglycosylceramidase